MLSNNQINVSLKNELINGKNGHEVNGFGKETEHESKKTAKEVNSKNAKKKALITGITGQDGSYLAELLLEKNYEVHGIIRRASIFNTARIDHLRCESQQKNANLILHYGDLTDSGCLSSIIARVRPDEIYNLGAQSHVQVSFETAEYTSSVDGLGTLRILEGIKLAGLEKTVKMYQASTSELYGKVQEIPQTEKTPFYPRSPYAVAKLFAYWAVINYREAFGIHASNGILFNHESPRRGATFVTRKITRAVAKIKLGQQECLYLGNLDAKRDWGHAKDYVYMMWLMLQQKTPDDYVIATGKIHSVREFAEKAFVVVGIELIWKGKGKEEVGIDKNSGKIVVRVDSRYFRPTEVDFLQGCSKKAKEKLGWSYQFSFDKLVKEMVESDLEMAKKGNFKF